MVTASHLPADRNGMKFFTLKGGYTKMQIQRLVAIAKVHAGRWYDMGILPPTSGDGAVYCSRWVDFMPVYELRLKQQMVKEVHEEAKTDENALSQTLKDLKIVLNAGSGSGGFFRRVLEDLGADVSASIHTTPDSNFPNGYIPNPESDVMIEETMRICEESSADIGIMLDTDADRCGFVVPRTVRADGTRADYEPLGRNRLIALLGVMFSKQSPGCAIVTDSVTSNGLATFLKENLGLVHVRYLKGYANVINKAKELTQSGVVNAEVAIETSGHCAMKENDYLDDGTYTAVKVVGLLAKEKTKHPTLSLLDLIKDMTEMDEVSELRMPTMDGTLETTQRMFDFIALEIEQQCESNIYWTIDQENLEGIRVSTGADGGFFMLRKSLHDPVISLQIEASSKECARDIVVQPLMQLLQMDPEIYSVLHLSALKEY
jgi:phosphomannomutase